MKTFFTFLSLLFILNGYSQVYILNEDFVKSTGTTPPFEWTNNKLTGTATDLWHFDNPGSRGIAYPITSPFAVFDAGAISVNGQPERVALESPFFDASISKYILLLFDQTFVADNGAKAIIEAFNGTAWVEVVRFTASTTNPSSEIIDISAVVGRVTNAKIRFIWEGQSQGYWALDNVKILAPLPIDGGLVKLDSPTAPFASGVNDVKVTLGSYGFQNITSTTIKWNVDGIQQPDYKWSGNLSIGKQQENISIGSYNFGKKPVKFKIWQNLPNGIDDPNHDNDSIVKTICASLCGTYTIGGTGADFATFSDAVSVLNTAGISCPVVFNVRKGVYNEQFVINDIVGSSATNTVTFQSESGDSTSVMIQYGQGITANLKHSGYINFKKIGFGGSSGLVLEDYANHINIDHCYFTSSNPISVATRSNNIRISASMFSNGQQAVSLESANDISILNNIFNIQNGQGASANSSRNVVFDGNQFNRNSTGISFYSTTNSIVKNNRLILSQQGSIGITLNSCDTLSVYNNYISMNGSYAGIGIRMYNTSHTGIYFNSLNIANTDIGKGSKGLWLQGGSLNNFKNNIFNIQTAGYPAWIETGTTGFSFDYNDYYSPSGLIGRYNDINYSKLKDWGKAVNGDANSKDLPPFFVSETNPLPYQRDFNGAGIPIGGILLDINGKIRNDQAPDIGAVEFMIDFGITQLLSPNLDCNHGNSLGVMIYLRQFGDLPFKDLKLSYQFNGGAIFTDMIPGVILNDMTYTFTTPVDISAQGEYHFRIWLINTIDDNLNNDTLVATRYTKPAPVVNFTQDNQCSGRDYQFTGTASIINPYTITNYEWLFGDGVTSTEQNPKHTFATIGTQKVTFRAYSNAGCYNEITKSIIVDNYEKLQLKLLKKNELCSKSCNGEVGITIIGGELPIQLYFNNVLTTQSKISNLCPGTYTVRAVDKRGCETSESVTIQTESPMDMKIVVDPIKGYAPLDVSLKAEGTGAATYEWYNKGKLFSNQPTTNITLIDKGPNVIKLVVNSGPPNNCIITDSVTINVQILVEIKIPNAFTPNGDGINDSIGPLTKCVTSLEMNINDRNGRFVHKIESLNDKWDGNMPSGIKAPQGVYYYSLKAIGYDDLEYTRQGNINLYRELINLLPNPVQSTAILDLRGNLSGDKTISIFSASGVLIRKWNTMENILQLDLSLLNHGVYLIKATDNLQVVVVKFIKN